MTIITEITIEFEAEGYRSRNNPTELNDFRIFLVNNGKKLDVTEYLPLSIQDQIANQIHEEYDNKDCSSVREIFEPVFGGSKHAANE